MAFDVAGEAYDRFMGRYSAPLARRLVEWLGPRVGSRVLDVGAGPGALTTVLAQHPDVAQVAAVDPSPSFLAALRQRLPDVPAARASAEDLPFDDDSFDTVVAGLVVHFMTDPVAGLAEMRRVTAPDGWVAATTWDAAGGRAPISLFGRAARDLHPAAPGEASLPGTGAGDLRDLFVRAGLREVEESELVVSVAHPSFEEWWAPYELGVGPAGDYVAGLDARRREALRAHCRELLPDPPFTLDAVAWVAAGRA